MGTIESALNQLASSQGGAVARWQLVGHGLSHQAVDRVVRRGGLRGRAAGVFVVAGSPENDWQRWWVAHLAAGVRSAIAFESAGTHWRFEGVRRSAPTVVVPHACSPTDEGIIVHRTRRLDAIDIRHVGGLPFTTPARTVLDLAARSGRARLGMIVDSAHFAGTARYDEVGAVLLRAGGRGRRGSGRLAQVLDERCGDPLSDSQLEHLLADLVAAAGLCLGRDAVRQHPLPAVGSTRGTVDLFLPEVMAIVEADGRRWHQRQADMKRDRDRDFAAAQVGVITVRLMHEHLTADLSGCADGLRRVVATRSTQFELGA